jgi:protein-S-isoprenylcysteine O-methyltransferase Ste14
MKIKGLDQLLKHVPELNTPLGALRFFLPAISLLFLVTASFTLRSLAWPYLLAGEILFGGLAFLLLYHFVRRRQEFKARFGRLAYSRAGSWLGFPAVAMLFALVARIRSLPGPAIAPGGWAVALAALGWALVALGALLALRAVQTFGVDNLAMLYVYFPEESRLVSHRIYNLLRHPAYSAVQQIAFGLALLNGSWPALACALLFALALWSWVRLVEEKELVERFGPDYVEYRRRIPAFWPHLHDLRGLFEFLLIGK